MTLIIGTDENDLKQRLDDLDQYVLRIEQSRCNIATRLEKLEKKIRDLEDEL